jgi:hypothetical protein
MWLRIWTSGSCEQDNEISGYINGKEFIVWLCDY